MSDSSPTRPGNYAKTALNLTTAFCRECLSSAKYGFYAKQAKQDGYEALSNLFFACSHSELIHMSMHARIALLLGIKLEALPVQCVSQPIPLILQDFLHDEAIAMRDYPIFLKEAESENCSAAILSMNAALKADETHYAFCKEVAESSDFWRNSSKNFYVCALCGYIHEWNRLDCPVCGARPDLFLAFPGSEHFDPESLLFTKMNIDERDHVFIDANLWKEERVIPSRLELTVGFISVVEESMRKKGWNERDIFSVSLALTEAAVNAVEHGNAHDESKTVRMECFTSDDFFYCSIEDQGEGFVPTDVPDPNLDENINRECGRGLKLIRGFMSRVWYNAKGNRIYMEKFRP